MEILKILKVLILIGVTCIVGALIVCGSAILMTSLSETVVQTLIYIFYAIILIGILYRIFPEFFQNLKHSLGKKIGKHSRKIRKQTPTKK